MTVIIWRQDGYCEKWDGITKITQDDNSPLALYRDVKIVAGGAYIKLEVV